MSDYVSLPKKAFAVFLNITFLANQIYAQMPPAWRVVQPQWWGDKATEVVDSGAAPANYGLANIGQAKWMVSQALKALEDTAPGTATAIRADLAGIVDFSVPSPVTQAWRDKQKSVLLVGQLKALAAPFYTRLNLVAPAWLDKESATYSEKGQLQLNGTKDAGAPGNYLPWTAGTSDDKNKAVATIGQLKAVFSLRFEHLSNIDTDGDGMPDLWEVGNGSNPNVYDRTAIKPGTSSSFYDLYLKSLGVGSEGYGTAPPAGLGTIPALTLDTEAPHTPVTALKGSMSVGADGSANYSLPIDIPKGTAGMEPKLSLNYSSNSGNGVMGVGWNLGGLQRITRGPASVAKDGFFDPMDFDVQSDGSTKDRFFLDGERLICVQGVYGAAGSVYRTEIDSFARITAVGTGPLSWKIETKAGLIVTLGTQLQSKYSLGTRTVAWCADNVSDTLGNYYSVTYDRDDVLSSDFDFTDQRVTSIKYTGNANGLAPYCSIDFTYENRPDVSRSFSAWSGSRTAKRMSKISVKTGSYLNHDYLLKYNISNQSGRSMLTSVIKCINGQLSKWVLPTYFSYDGLGENESLWKNPDTTSIPTYSDNLDASGEVNSMVSAYDENTSIRLIGDVARAYKMPDKEIYPDSRLTFEVASGAMVSGAFIGLEGDTAYTSADSSSFCRIGGDGSSVKMADGVNFPSDGRFRSYTPGEGWKQITLNLGAEGVTGLKRYLVLMCVDNDLDDGVDSVAFRNVKIYRSNTQTAADVSPILFEVDTQMPRLSDSNGGDLGVASLDLNGDALPDLADWRVTDYDRNSSNDLLPRSYGRIFRNMGSRFAMDDDLVPPSKLPLGSRSSDGNGYDYSSKHHLLAQPTDVDGDGSVDLLGSVDLQTNTDKTYLRNEYSFYTYDGSAWVEKTGWRLPFYIDNTSSTNGNGGKKRDEHFQWVDLNSDGYQDLVVHTTNDGRLYNRTTGTQLHDPDSDDSDGESFAFINKGRDGPGWIIDTKRYLPVPLMEDGKDVGRRILDLDGDGIPELVQSRYESGSTLLRRNHFLMNSGSYYWTAATTSHPYDLPAALVLSNEQPAEGLLVDLNGDGLADMLRSSKNSGGLVSEAWMNHGTRAWAAESNPGSDAYAQLSSYRFPYPLHVEKTIAEVNQRVPYGFEMADINGDGLVDILYSDEENTETAGSDNLTFLNTGNGWQAMESWGLPSTYRIYTSESDRKDRKRRCRLQDVNGDGFPDLITGLLNNTPKVWYNNCRPEVMKTATDGMTSELQIDYKRLNDPTPVADFDNKRVYEKGTATLPYGQAHVIDSRLVVSSYSEPDGRSGRRVRYQRYGDLRYDRNNESSLGFGWIEAKDALNQQVTRTETERSYPFGGSPKNTKTWTLVKSSDVVPALAGTPTGMRLLSEETATYGEMASWSGPGGTIRRPVQTGSVKTLWDLAGIKVSQTTTVQNAADFDIYGFVKKSTVTSLDGTQVKTESTYDNLTTGGRWYLGRLLTSTVTKSGGGRPTLVKNSSFEYYDTTHGLLKSETIEPSNALKSKKTYIYDTSGNITDTSVTGSGVTRTSSSAYDEDRRFVVSESNQLSHTVRYQYDRKRALLLSSTDINGLTSRFEYDAYGTRILTRLPDGTKTGESTGYYIQNAPFTLPSQVLSYLNAAGESNPVGIRYYRAKQSSGCPVGIVYLDPYGRELVTSTTILRSFADGVSTYSKIYTITRYDNLGRQEYISEPFAAGEVPRFTQINYDVAGRVLRTTHPDGTVDQVETFSTAATDPLNPLSYSLAKTAAGRYIQRWEDQHGRLIQSCDESGLVTRFIHDQEGRVCTVELGGSEVLRNKFDIFGNKYEVWEINSGTTSSAYNAFGALTQSTNANGKVTDYFHDVLGRVERVRKPDGEGDYYTFYDQALGAGLGKPWKMTEAGGYQQIIAYDSLGRPGVATKTQIAPGQTAPETTSNTTYYDALGRVSSQTDAGGLTVVHSYDATYSFPTKLTIGPGMPGAGKDLWKAGSYDSKGRVTSQFLAQDVTTGSTYNPVNDQLATLTASRPGTSLQSKSYVWDDESKNLESRTDVLKSLSETFEYDPLNRLAKTTSTGSGAPPVAVYTYDSGQKGNLTSKPGAALTYAGTRPHAVSQATVKGFTRNYVYDDAGYVKNDGRRDYKWTSFGQLKELKYTSAPALQDLNGVLIYAASQVQCNFTFDATGNRSGQLKERIAADDSRLLEETLYLGSYEREIHSSKANGGATPVITRTVHRHNISGFAVYTRIVKPGIPVETKLTTLLKDHLGSTDVLLTGTWNGSDFVGQVTEEQSFDPWGERRSSGNLANFRTGDADAFRTSARDYDRGYTSHEQLDDSGLIHMNGRIYDPELGRMLSPDRYVQVPEYSQNFNRYSYVMNNPLNMTDPSGMSVLDILTKPLNKLGDMLGSWGKEAVARVAQAVVTFYVTIWAGPRVGYAAGSAAYAGTMSGLNGGGFNDVHKAAGVAYVSAYIGSGIDQYAGGLDKYTGAFVRAAGHGVVNGATNEAMGGKFQDGFISASSSSLLYSMGEYSGLGGRSPLLTNAVVGGTVSVIGGGKFGNGAATSAYAYLVTSVADSGLQSYERSRHTVKMYVSESHPDFSGVPRFLDNAIEEIKYNLPLEALGPMDGMVFSISEAFMGLRALVTWRYAVKAAPAIPPLRQAYVADVEALRELASSSQAAGESAEVIARMLHAARNALKVKYRELTPPHLVEQFELRNIEKYGNALGPTIEHLRAAGKTWEQIIESATRSGGADLGF